MVCASLDTPAVSLAEHAAALARSAHALNHARDRATSDVAFSAALDHTMELWMAIKATVASARLALPPAVASNLDRLSDYVIGTIRHHGAQLSEPTLDKLVTINAQVAASLTEDLREAA